MKEVKLWYAYNEKDEVVRIEDIKECEKYHCPCCGEGVYPKALKSKKVTMHFCHENGKSCSINGGENFIHKFVKEVAFQKGQQIKVNTEDSIKDYTIDEIILEKSYKTSLGDYRPDITIITECGERIFIEICNTNRKSIDKYWGKWLYLGNIVIELKAKDLINNKFEIGTLEPIFPTFENMSNSDWKSLTGYSVTNEEKREFLTNLYKAIYDWKNGKNNLDKAIDILVEYTFKKSVADNKKRFDYANKIIDKYICDTVDKKYIKENIENAIKLKSHERIEKYRKEQDLFIKQKSIWRDVERKVMKYFNIKLEWDKEYYRNWKGKLKNYYIPRYYYRKDKEKIYLNLDFSGKFSCDITIAIFKNNIAKIKSVIYNKPIEYYLENENELYEGVEDLLQELKDNNIK